MTDVDSKVDGGSGPTRFERWVWQYAMSPREQAAFRIAHAGLILVTGVPGFSWLERQIPTYYYPPEFSLAAFVPRWPPDGVYHALSLSLVALYVALLFGWRTRWVSLGLSAVMAVGLTFAYSFGKIAHQHVFFWLLPTVMAFSRWGDVWSIDARDAIGGRGVRNPSRPGRWSDAVPVALLALLIAAAYCTAGTPKALAWLDLDLQTQGARRWLIEGYHTMGRRAWLAETFYRMENFVVWESMDVAACMLEVGFLFAVVRREWFRAFAGVALVFHAANYFILNIDFTRLVLVYLLVLPWPVVLAMRPRWPIGSPFRPAVMLAVGVPIVAGYAAALWLSPSYRPLWFQPIPETLGLIGVRDSISDGGFARVLFNVALSIFVGPLLMVPMLKGLRDRLRRRASAE